MSLSSKRASSDELLDSPQEVSITTGPEVTTGQGRSHGLQERVPPMKCPRCDSTNTKFCYYNNYSRLQPRHFCRACRRYWTHGGILRKVPVGGCRRSKRPKITDTTTTDDNNTGNGDISSNQILIPQKQQQLSAPLGCDAESSVFSDILHQALSLSPPTSLPLSNSRDCSSFEDYLLSPPTPFLFGLVGKEEEPLSSYDCVMDSFSMPSSSCSSSLSNVSVQDSFTEEGLNSFDSLTTITWQASPDFSTFFPSDSHQHR